MTRRIRRIAVSSILCLLCTLLFGCEPGAKPAAGSGQTDLIALDLATPTPTIMPLVPPGGAQDGELPDEPDMTFDESGNIWFSDAMKARFGARTFTFDHAPRVLIYHTHAREAFREEVLPTPTPGETPSLPARNQPQNASKTPRPGNAASTRSEDPEKTVVHLGDQLAAELERYGFVVQHDRTDVEAPSLSTAYERSADVMAAYDGIDLYIDLHRNAADPIKGQNDVVIIKGKRCARMFFVVGTGMDALDAAGMQNWRENYTLAYSVYERLAQIHPQLVKENRVKQGRYNQQMGLCLLAEIGHNANLMRDAEHTLPLFASALADVCRW